MKDTNECFDQMCTIKNFNLNFAHIANYLILNYVLVLLTSSGNPIANIWHHN